MIGKKSIDNNLFYVFKDVCDILNIKPKDRTRYGRMAKKFAKKISKLDENGKELLITYINTLGVYVILSEMNFINKIKSIFKLRKDINIKQLFKIVFCSKYRDKFYNLK